jgi:hypothetical protein
MPDSSFLDAQLTYESLGSIDLDSAIANLDTALSKYNSSGYTETTGKDYPGFDISCRHNISPTQLKRECDENPNCNSYNVVAPWNGGCLKHASGPLTNNPSVVFYEKQADKWETIGSETQRVTVDANTRVRFGTDNRWVYKTASGSFTITNDFFGRDPAPGVGKRCEKAISGSSNAVETAFAPIAEYYSKLANINETLRKYIGKTAKDLADSDPRLINEERYSNRVNPEEAVMPREVTNGLIPELRQSSLPYMISISVFMATLSIFLIFQMNGFSGQINIPPGVAAWFASPAPDARPFYENPMILGGIAIIAVSGLVIFAILYFQAKNTNRSRQ